MSCEHQPGGPENHVGQADVIAPATLSVRLAALRQAGRALRSRNYQLFFVGQGISLVGTWMQRIALPWLVYRITGSVLLLGVVAFSGQIATFLFAPVAGVLADRMDRRLLLIATQGAAMIQALMLAELTLMHVITPGDIVALSVLLGMINAFDIPIRQSFVVEMVETGEDLPNAIALNSFLFNSARLIGPTIAGAVIAVVGEGMCFLLNAVSFLGAIAALCAMQIRPREMAAGQQSPLHNLKEGFSYALGYAPMWATLLNVALINFLAMPYMVLMPVFAGKVLLGGASTLGFLMAAVGLGALAGAGFLASRRSTLGLPRYIAVGGLLFGGGLIAFSFSRNLPFSLAMLTIVGFGFMVQLASSNTLVQTIVDESKRGRVMSIYIMANMGMGTFGSLLGGWTAAHIGAPWTLTIVGAGCIFAAGLFAARFSVLNAALRERAEVRTEVVA